MADVIEQEALEEQKQKRVHRLQDIMLRNAGLEGKKGLGTLEIHVNGLRYQGNRADQRIGMVKPLTALQRTLTLNRSCFQ